MGFHYYGGSTTSSDDFSSFFYASQQWQNPLFESTNNNINECADNLIRQTPKESETQVKMAKVLLNLRPLGLTIQFPEETNHRSKNGKTKAVNFSASLLRIGVWQKEARNDGDVVAKCYYAKRKLVWEILENGLKSKMEVQWSDIVGMRAVLEENQPGVLEIEVRQPPKFFKESVPTPKKHTLWNPVSDFTNGEARIHRRHYLKFPPGVLNKHYEKLLQSECFYETSKSRFPSHESLYFDDTCSFGQETNSSMQLLPYQGPPAHPNQAHLSQTNQLTYDDFMSSIQSHENSTNTPLLGTFPDYQIQIQSILPFDTTSQDNMTIPHNQIYNPLATAYKQEGSGSQNPNNQLQSNMETQLLMSETSQLYHLDWPLKWQVPIQNINVAEPENVPLYPYFEGFTNPTTDQYVEEATHNWVDNWKGSNITEGASWDLSGQGRM